MMTGMNSSRNCCICGQAPNTCGRPQNVCGQPQNMCGQPQNICGQPQNVCSQPQNVCSQPQNMCGQPQNMCGQPQNVCSRPQTMCGQVQTREQLMRRINESSFAVNEAVLFLDTHPDCEEALRYYREVSEMRTNAVNAYQRQFGPLTSNDAAGNSWTWINGKWPWEGGC